jgi:hypothetical protein
MNKCKECGNDNTDNLKYCRWCGHELSKPKIEEIQSIEQKPTKKANYKNLTGIIGGCIAFAVSYFLIQQILFAPPTLDKAMMKTASEINESCPIMVDTETRLDNTIALPSNIFQYNYTLINREKETVDIAMLKSYLEPNITNFVRTNPAMKFQRDNKITVNYYYKDKNGNYLLTISVTPEQYE